MLVIGNYHHKNLEGLEKIFKHLKYDYKFGTIDDIYKYTTIFSADIPIDTSKYPNKNFIFGPHFSVFPNKKLFYINNVHKNSIYIQPSDWARDTWNNMTANKYINIKTFAFPVNVEKFNDTEQTRDSVFIYYKRRTPEELEYIEKFLKDKNIEYRIFNYINGYDESEYLSYLQKSKYGIILDAHESQGFAIEEALSCNVPLLVWNTKDMSQEYGGYYPKIPCTTIPYWDERCGEYFYEQDKFIETFNIFIEKLETYKPREYILENLSVEECSKKFKELITHIEEI